MTMPRRFVALGDSFTEGVGDVDRRLPNNRRGWADRVAEEFARHDDRTLYANLAVRGRRLQRIVDEQLEPALALNPTLISFYAGGNDLLMARLNLGRLMRDYENAVMRLKASGATIVLFTDQWLSPIARFARHVISARTAVPSNWDSNAAILAVVEALMASATKSLWDLSKARMEALEMLRKSVPR